MTFAEEYYRLRKEDNREKKLEDMSVLLRQDFEDILLDLDEISRYTYRDIRLLRVGNYQSEEYVSTYEIFQKIRLLKDISGTTQGKFLDKSALLRYIKRSIQLVICDDKKFKKYDFIFHIAENENEDGKYRIINETLIIPSIKGFIPIANAIDQIADIEIDLEKYGEYEDELDVNIVFTNNSNLYLEFEIRKRVSRVTYISYHDRKADIFLISDEVEDYFFKNYLQKSIELSTSEVITIFNYIVKTSKANEWFFGSLSIDDSRNVLVDSKKTGIYFSDITNIKWGYNRRLKSPYIDIYIKVGDINDAVRFYNQGIFIRIPGVGDCDTIDSLFSVLEKNRTLTDG